jgi:hypothetical protein
MKQNKVTASIRITGEKLDLEAISSVLNIKPTHVHKKGDLDMTKEKYRQDMWLLTSPLSQKKSLDLHLKWLEKKLKPYYGYLVKLKSRAKIDIFCSYTSCDQLSGFSLSSTALSIFTELDVKMEISLIFLN